MKKVSGAKKPFKAKMNSKLKKVKKAAIKKYSKKKAY